MRIVGALLAGGLTILLHAVPVQAQVEWRVMNFLSVSQRFEAILQFRNVQSVSTAPILVVSQVTLTACANARAGCGASTNCDGFDSAVSLFVTGNVDRRTFTDAISNIWVDQSSA